MLQKDWTVTRSCQWSRSPHQSSWTNLTMEARSSPIMLISKYQSTCLITLKTETCKTTRLHNLWFYPLRCSEVYYLQACKNRSTTKENIRFHCTRSSCIMYYHSFRFLIIGCGHFDWFVLAKLAVNCTTDKHLMCLDMSIFHVPSNETEN
jgi:hypothetical protein